MLDSKFQVSFGVVIDEKGYIILKNSQINFQFFMPNSNKLLSLERLWFMFHNGCQPIICKHKPNFYDIFLNSGLLVEVNSEYLSDNHMQNYDYIMSNVYDKALYISLCNELRTKIATHISKNFRWNGCEKESILNPEIYERASYLNGLAKLGSYITYYGELNNDITEIGYETKIMQAYDTCLKLESDGQRKLFSCMYGFAQQRDIIYIGGSPGIGWQKALNSLGSNILIINFDPGNMDKIYSNVIHIPIAVYTPEDILKNIDINKKYDFVWDVRHEDASKLRDVDEVIQGEIRILNSIIRSEKLREIIVRYQIKINVKNIIYYNIPKDIRFFLQPFCYGREESYPISELRGVFVLHKETELVNISMDIGNKILGHVQDIIMKQKEFLSEFNYTDNKYCDERLFINCLYMRYDLCNFIDVPIPSDIDVDIFLFCLNCNDEASLERLLSKLEYSKKAYIGSFFTRSRLNVSEFEFKEMSLLCKNFRATVMDSRIIIQRKIFSLYLFFSGINIDYFDYEVFCSETYIIKYCEMMLRQRLGLDMYDNVRNQISEEYGAKFIKFPNSFSLSDRLVSPSGHAARMVYYHNVCGDISLNMFFYKIVRSFSRHGRSKRYLKNKWRKKWVWDEILPVGFFKYSSGVAERCSNDIWHSIVEWKIGVKSGGRLGEAEYNREYIVFEEMLDNILTADFEGEELANILRNRGYEKTGLVRRVNAALKFYNLHPRLTQLEICGELKKFIVDSNFSWEDIIMLNKGSDNLRTLAIHCKIDKSLMNYWIHSSYVIYLSDNKYINHDISKIGPEELVNNTIYSNFDNDKKYIQPHYDKNPHHPEHYDNENSTLTMTLESIDEMVIDLAARRWEHDLTFRSVITGKMLWDIDEYILKRSVNIIQVKESMQRLIPKDKIYRLDDVKNIFRNRTKNYFGV